MIKFKEFFFNWDEAKCDTFLKDPEYISNVSYLLLANQLLLLANEDLPLGMSGYEFPGGGRV